MPEHHEDTKQDHETAFDAKTKISDSKGAKVGTVAILYRKSEDAQRMRNDFSAFDADADEQPDGSGEDTKDCGSETGNKSKADEEHMVEICADAQSDLLECASCKMRQVMSSFSRRQSRQIKSRKSGRCSTCITQNVKISSKSLTSSDSEELERIEDYDLDSRGMVSVVYDKDMANESDENVCSEDGTQGKNKYEEESECDDNYDPNEDSGDYGQDAADDVQSESEDEEYEERPKAKAKGQVGAGYKYYCFRKHAKFQIGV